MVVFGTSGLDAAPKLNVGATVAVEAAGATDAVVELLLAGAVTDGATVAAGVDEELKLKAGVIDGPIGF